MTSDDFTRHEENRLALATLLSNPTLRTALDILKDEVAPAHGGAADANPVLAAAKYHIAAGANHVIDGLERLTRLPVQRAMPNIKKLMKDLP
jgi:hypothetical protein